MRSFYKQDEITKGADSSVARDREEGGFPMEGINRQELDSFIKRVGTNRLMTLTTQQVCSQFIKVFTADDHLSYCSHNAYLDANGSENQIKLKRPTVIIFHSM